MLLASAALVLTGAGPALAAPRASHHARSSAAFSPLGGASGLASDGRTTCAIVTGGAVKCWGQGEEGELGNGTIYDSDTGASGSAVSVQVLGVGGTGTLTGVRSMASDGRGFCALVSGGGVDCWGANGFGALGNGMARHLSRSAVPVQVVGVGRSGTLSGVSGLVSYEGSDSYCALLSGGGVDCWGAGSYGQLGNGHVYGSDQDYGSSVPVAVVGEGKTGLLTGVSALAAGRYGGICALGTSGGVDCWGYGTDGELGNGKFRTSATPVPVEAVGGTGRLTGVSSLTGGGQGVCALVSGQGVDCWGHGSSGELGNGKLYSTGTPSSAVPVQVKGVGGAGTLTGVTSLASDGVGYCAALGTNGVACWGAGNWGQLGNGKLYSTGTHSSPVPVDVKGVGGNGTLSAVATLTSTQGGYCALLTDDEVDCWGYGDDGEIGGGKYYTAGGRDFTPVPARVVSLDGTGTLTEVDSLTRDDGGYCAVLASGGVDCWGDGYFGELGNGKFYSNRDPHFGSAIPVQVR